jgi:uncharacterized protein
VDALGLFLTALGLAMFLEGLPYFVSPAGTRQLMERIRRLGDGTLRWIGFCLMAGGLILAWLARP